MGTETMTTMTMTTTIEEPNKRAADDLKARVSIANDDAVVVVAAVVEGDASAVVVFGEQQFHDDL